MRLPSLLKSPRMWGLVGTALAGYLLIFVVLGKTDVSWMLPTKKIAQTILEVWPDLPFFTVQREPINGGKAEEIYFTVPTRQLTPEELTRLEGTNRMAHPSAPSTAPTSTSAR